MSSTALGVYTITSPMTSVFTPPSSCSTHWTYEQETANSIPGGLLMQAAQNIQPDHKCFPTGFNGWGRAPSFIQIFSPGTCPIGYTAAVNNFNGETTTEVCCPRHFLYTSTVSGVIRSNKTAEFCGCTSIFPASAGVTTVFAESHGFRSVLDGSTTNFVLVAGPVTMWAQPITVAFQKSDLSLFAASISTTSTSSATGGSQISSTSPPLPSKSSSSGLSHGTVAGIVIAVLAVLGLLIGGAILLQRKDKSMPWLSSVRNIRRRHQDSTQRHRRQQRVGMGQINMCTERQFNTLGQYRSHEQRNVTQQKQASELSTHTDRRHELE